MERTKRTKSEVKVTKSGQKISADKHSALVYMWRCGCSITEISNALKVSDVTVCKYRKLPPPTQRGVGLYNLNLFSDEKLIEELTTRGVKVGSPGMTDTNTSPSIGGLFDIKHYSDEELARELKERGVRWGVADATDEELVKELEGRIWGLINELTDEELRDNLTKAGYEGELRKTRTVTLKVGE